MPGEPRDAAHLWDMRDGAETMLRISRGRTRADYDSDETLRLAIERLAILIGEAARRISPAFRAEAPEIPWRQIVGQRNVLVHEYDRVDADRIWELTVQHAEVLVGQLTALMPATPEDPEPES